MAEHNAKQLADRLLNSDLVQVLTATFGPRGSKLDYIKEDTGLSDKAIHDALAVLKAYDLVEVMEGTSNHPAVYRSCVQKLELIIAQGHANIAITTTKGRMDMTLTTKELANETSFMKGLQGSIKAAFRETFDYTKKALLEAIRDEVRAELDSRKAAGAHGRSQPVPKAKPAAKPPSKRYLCSKCNRQHNQKSPLGQNHLKFKVEEK